MRLSDMPIRRRLTLIILGVSLAVMLLTRGAFFYYEYLTFRETTLRHLSSLETQFRVLQCLDQSAVPTPRPYWFERDAAILDAPFLVMEKVQGVCPNPWGREGRAFYRAAAERARSADRRRHEADRGGAPEAYGRARRQDVARRSGGRAARARARVSTLGLQRHDGGAPSPLARGHPRHRMPDARLSARR